MEETIEGEVEMVDDTLRDVNFVDNLDIAYSSAENSSTNRSMVIKILQQIRIIKCSHRFILLICSR